MKFGFMKMNWETIVLPIIICTALVDYRSGGVYAFKHESLKCISTHLNEKSSDAIIIVTNINKESIKFVCGYRLHKYQPNTFLEEFSLK